MAQTAKTAKAQDGKAIADGKKATLVLLYDGGDHPRRSYRYSEVEKTGTVRAFEQDGETRWELLTGDEQYPAIGFLPENVKTVS